MPTPYTFYWVVRTHVNSPIAGDDYVALCTSDTVALAIYKSLNGNSCCNGFACSVRVQQGHLNDARELVDWMMSVMIPAQRIHLQPIQLDCYYPEGLVNAPIDYIEAPR